MISKQVFIYNIISLLIMKVGINTMAILLGLYLYQIVSSNEIFRGSKAISPCSDRILVEDVDASDLNLSYRFHYIENDTLASDKLIKSKWVGIIAATIAIKHREFNHLMIDKT